jgi:hypothetical protein
MVPKEKINILDIISILIISLLGNFMIGLKLNFHHKFDLIIISKVLLLGFSSFSLYLIVIKLKKLLSEAEREYYGYTDLDERANNSIDRIYNRLYKKEQGKINGYILFSIMSAITFFLIDPITSLIIG